MMALRGWHSLVVKLKFREIIFVVNSQATILINFDKVKAKF